MGVVALYPNISHGEGLSILRKQLKSRKKITFTFKEKSLKQKRGTDIGTKFTRPCSIIFMAELETDITKESEYKTYFWWRYIDDMFFFFVEK